MVTRFHDLRIQYKLLVVFAPLFVICLLAISSIVYYNVEKTMIRNICEFNVSKLKQISDKIEILNRNIISVTNVYYLNQDIRAFLKYDSGQGEYDRSRQLSMMTDTVQTIRSNFDYLKFSTTIVGMNSRFFSDADQNEQKNRQRTEKWKMDISRKPGEIYWSNTYDYNNKYIFSAVRYLQDIYTGNPLGYLIIDFDEDILFRTYENKQGENHFIMDSQGTVISNKDKQLLSVSLSGEPFLQRMGDYDSGYFQSSYRKTKMLVSFYKVPNLNWYIVDMVPENEVLQGVYGTKKFIYLLTLLSLVFILLLTYMLANMISSPLKKLALSMNSLQAGNVQVSLELDRKDEVGILAFRFNAMVNRINELIQEVVQEHEERRKYEFKALQAQINPHFLYNTLSSIRWMARSNRPEVVNNMIISLVRLLRQSISSQEEYFSFRDELQFLQDYVYIQKIRYADKFQVQFQFKPTVLSCKTLKLIIQPLLENAIFHGIEPKDGTGTIQVNAYPADSVILIEVIDDGVGFNYARKQVADSSSEGGLALENIQRRIRQHYGPQYGCRVESSPGRGTKITVTLPMIR
ncbi:sensor histidine kinase [Paenibacillus piri]|uniref:histidine kinase n=1 Tax=Paenibacillus piri TaxID=2547395 RepID=A0A4R5KJV8_9BACL|nr:sensor histidine kinase [Paenibacillus piri]TDF95118.1 sensor histidine kinase [Paenibacillus piri]